MVTWPAAGLQLIVESALSSLRELDRLEAAEARGGTRRPAPTAARTWPRHSRCATAGAGASAKELAAWLRIAPQTANALLRDLQAKSVVRQVTGSGRFGRSRVSSSAATGQRIAD